MRRTHPSNAFGWLFVEAAAHQRAMNEQARLSDQAQQADPQFSGEPPGFSAWALDHVRQLIGTDPSISRQISGRINELQTKLQRLDAERQRQQAAWDAEHAALVSRLEQLIALVP